MNRTIPTDLQQERKPQGSITPLRDFLVEDDENSPKRPQFEFKLTPRTKDKGGRTYKIYATSAQEKNDWMEALRFASEGGTQNKTSLEIEEKLRRNCYDIPPNDLEWEAATNGVLGKGSFLLFIFILKMYDRSLRSCAARIVVKDH